jgi:hypothetical protein
MTGLPLGEGQVGQQCDRIATLMGWEVERYEQRRASRIHEGLPDRRYVHRAKGLTLWVELKGMERSSKLSVGQHQWLADELNAGQLATCIDSPPAFQRLLNGMTGTYARAEGLRICRELLQIVALKGFRTEKAKAS